MTELVREWLLGITGAAILTAIADGLMPEGGIKQAGKLVCGLVLLFAVLRPVAGENMTGLPEQMWYDQQLIELRAQELRKEADLQMKQVIEMELSAYSMDKMEQYGVPCQIQVICKQTQDGVFLPDLVQVSGVSSQQVRQDILQILGEELGLEHTRFTFLEGVEA